LYMTETQPEIRLGSLLAVFGTAALVAGGSYLLPGFERYQPYKPGDPIPVLASLTPKTQHKVVEDERDGLVAMTEVMEDTGQLELAENLPSTAEPVELPGAAPAESTVPVPTTAPAATAAGGSRYKAGVATPLEDPGHKGMAHYFRALKDAAEGKGVARAIHYGDSTIAADGIAKTVRKRMAERFGNAGPGFISAAMDPRWNKRTDIQTSRSGSWSNKSILNGGGGGRYGLGGVVAIGQPGSYVTVRPLDLAGAPLTVRHLEVWYQAGVGYGNFWASANDKELTNQAATAEATEDRRFTVDVPEGFQKAAFGVSGGPLAWYGMVLETGTPGATWEALGVIGVGSKSFNTFSKAHLSAQTASRSPDLIVLMIGGNEAGYPSLSSGSGDAYLPIYQSALETVRSGYPEASCLVVTPLDQGTYDESGQARSKGSIPRMVNVQRKVAQAAGCAFWSAFDAMGGSGSIVRWASYKSPLAWADLLHLSGTGLEIIGNLLSDAIQQDYDAWRNSGGA
jgi:lysophospholipase L1-like esterase